jgi:uncharacterized membrane protein
MSLDLILRLALALLAAIGLADSLVFALNALRHREVEVSCRDGSCVRLSKLPYARVFFGMPNWAFGIVFYWLVIFAAFTTNASLVGLALLGSFIAFLLTIYLVWALAIKLKVICRLCYLAHAVNASLFVLWIIILLQLS